VLTEGTLEVAPLIEKNAHVLGSYRPCIELTALHYAKHTTEAEMRKFWGELLILRNTQDHISLYSVKHKITYKI
jgi:hypothetical protein